LSLSEQQLVDCCNYNGSQGCNGGDEDTAFDYAKDFGMNSEAEYVYTAQTQDCKYNNETIFARPKNRTNVIKNNATDMMAAVAAGPVSVALEADTLIFQFYTGGILNSNSCGLDMDHAVVVVGYGTDRVYGPYYIVRNSWGPLWGVNGYINIAIVDGPGICGIQQDASYPTF
jgi:C1A family cysteine protease